MCWLSVLPHTPAVPFRAQLKCHPLREASLTLCLMLPVHGSSSLPSLIFSTGPTSHNLYVAVYSSVIYLAHWNVSSLRTKGSTACFIHQGILRTEPGTQKAQEKDLLLNKCTMRFAASHRGLTSRCEGEGKTKDLGGLSQTWVQVQARRNSLTSCRTLGEPRHFVSLGVPI